MKSKSIHTILALALAAALLAGFCVFPVSAGYDTSGATAFVFSDGGIAVTEGNYTGYKLEGTALTINGAGVYVLSGSCADGSVKVKKGTTGVTLLLDGLTLTSATTAPICCNKSTEVTVVAAAGSVNTLTDSAYNNDDNYPDNEDAESAVVKAKDGAKLTLCGTGTINVIANGKNGVKGGATTEDEGEASLTVKELTLHITAPVNDGLKSDQELNILSGTVTVSAADDGIKSDYVLNIGAAGTAGPVVTVTESTEGIEAATLNIYSGSVTVHAADDGINAANSDLTNYDFSCAISGGTVYVDAQGDGIDSNGSLSISGGTVEVYSASSGDNSPLDAESAVSVTGGTVLAVGAPGMGVSFAQGSQSYVMFGSGAMGGGPGMGGQQPGGPGMGGWNNSSAGAAELMAFGGPGSNPGGMGAGLSVSAGSTLAILDADGNTVYSATAVRAASMALFSSDTLTGGESYTLTVNGTAAATATAATGSGAGGNPGDGTQSGTGTEPPAQPGAGEQPDQPGSGDEPPAPPTEGEQTTPPADGGQAPAASGFGDVAAGAWYAEAVAYVSETGLMQGVGGGSFDPNGAASRAMVAAILYRLAGSPAVSCGAGFSDVAEGQWYTDAVLWAAENGIVEGYADGTFRPGAAITREQLAALLHRYSVLNGTADENADLSAFTDADAVSAWAEDALGWAVGAGLLRGSGGRLNPKATATRAQLAQILMNYLA
ncbi:MAG: carbohydrate-binding domain-containing protein [Oscillospiraceae bacterium]|nr:carbohydrate-binding domain-containing protein [Oscillospiraceae bacterium]